MKPFLQTSLRYHAKNVTPRKHWARFLVTRTMANWAASLRVCSCNLQRDLADRIAPRCTPICKQARSTQQQQRSGSLSLFTSWRPRGDPGLLPARFLDIIPHGESCREELGHELCAGPHPALLCASLQPPSSPTVPRHPCRSPPPESGPLSAVTPSLRVPPAEPAAAAPGPWGILAFPTVAGVARGRERETDSKEKQQMKSKLALHKFSDDFYKDATV